MPSYADSLRGQEPQQHPSYGISHAQDANYRPSSTGSYGSSVSAVGTIPTPYPPQPPPPLHPSYATPSTSYTNQTGELQHLISLPTREQVHHYLIARRRQPAGLETGWKIEDRPLDAYILFSTVIGLGGSVQVTERGWWTRIATALDLPLTGSIDPPDALRRFFTTMLKELEQMWEETKAMNVADGRHAGHGPQDRYGQNHGRDLGQSSQSQSQSQSQPRSQIPRVTHNTTERYDPVRHDVGLRESYLSTGTANTNHHTTPQSSVSPANNQPGNIRIHQPSSIRPPTQGNQLVPSRFGSQTSNSASPATQQQPAQTRFNHQTTHVQPSYSFTQSVYSPNAQVQTQPIPSSARSTLSTQSTRTLPTATSHLSTSTQSTFSQQQTQHVPQTHIQHDQTSHTQQHVQSQSQRLSMSQPSPSKRSVSQNTNQAAGLPSPVSHQPSHPSNTQGSERVSSQRQTVNQASRPPLPTPGSSAPTRFNHDSSLPRTTTFNASTAIHEAIKADLAAYHPPKFSTFDELVNSDVLPCPRSSSDELTTGNKVYQYAKRCHEILAAVRAMATKEPGKRLSLDELVFWSKLLAILKANRGLVIPGLPNNPNQTPSIPSGSNAHITPDAQDTHVSSTGNPPHLMATSSSGSLNNGSASTIDPNSMGSAPGTSKRKNPPQLDEQGNPIKKKRGRPNKTFVDANGNPIPRTPPLDENGQPILKKRGRPPKFTLSGSELQALAGKSTTFGSSNSPATNNQRTEPISLVEAENSGVNDIMGSFSTQVFDQVTPTVDNPAREPQAGPSTTTTPSNSQKQRIIEGDTRESIAKAVAEAVARAALANKASQTPPSTSKTSAILDKGTPNNAAASGSASKITVPSAQLHKTIIPLSSSPKKTISLSSGKAHVGLRPKEAQLITPTRPPFKSALKTQASSLMASVSSSLPVNSRPAVGPSRSTKISNGDSSSTVGPKSSTPKSFTSKIPAPKPISMAIRSTRSQPSPPVIDDEPQTRITRNTSVIPKGILKRPSSVTTGPHKASPISTRASASIPIPRKATPISIRPSTRTTPTTSSSQVTPNGSTARTRPSRVIVDLTQSETSPVRSMRSSQNIPTQADVVQLPRSLRIVQNIPSTIRISSMPPSSSPSGTTGEPKRRLVPFVELVSPSSRVFPDQARSLRSASMGPKPTGKFVSRKPTILVKKVPNPKKPVIVPKIHRPEKAATVVNVRRKRLRAVNRARVVMTISRRRRARLIQAGRYDPFRDDDSDSEGIIHRGHLRPKIPLPKTDASRWARPRSPEPIPKRFVHRPGPNLLEPYRSLLTEDTLPRRAIAHECGWKGCDAVLASEWHLQRHVDLRQHALQGRFAAGTYGEEILWKCHWQGCEAPASAPCFPSLSALRQHITAKHIAKALMCPYPDCGLVSPNISHLTRHVIKTHDLPDDEPVPLATAAIPPKIPAQFKYTSREGTRTSSPEVTESDVSSRSSESEIQSSDRDGEPSVEITAQRLVRSVNVNVDVDVPQEGEESENVEMFDVTTEPALTAVDDLLDSSNGGDNPISVEESPVEAEVVQLPPIAVIQDTVQQDTEALASSDEIMGVADVGHGADVTILQGTLSSTETVVPPTEPTDLSTPVSAPIPEVSTSDGVEVAMETSQMEILQPAGIDNTAAQESVSPPEDVALDNLTEPMVDKDETGDEQSGLTGLAESLTAPQTSAPTEAMEQDSVISTNGVMSTEDLEMADVSEEPSGEVSKTAKEGVVIEVDADLAGHVAEDAGLMVAGSEPNEKANEDVSVGDQVGERATEPIAPDQSREENQSMAVSVTVPEEVDVPMSENNVMEREPPLVAREESKEKEDDPMDATEAVLEKVNSPMASGHLGAEGQDEPVVDVDDRTELEKKSVTPAVDPKDKEDGSMVFGESTEVENDNESKLDDQPATDMVDELNGEVSTEKEDQPMSTHDSTSVRHLDNLSHMNVEPSTIEDNPMVQTHTPLPPVSTSQDPTISPTLMSDLVDSSYNPQSNAGSSISQLTKEPQPSTIIPQSLRTSQRMTRKPKLSLSSKRPEPTHHQQHRHRLPPLPEYVRAEQLTTPIVPGTTYRSAHRIEWVRVKVFKGSMAGPDPIIHFEHPPHMLSAPEEDDTPPPEGEDGKDVLSEDPRAVDKVLGKKRKWEVVVLIKTRKSELVL
ncbi:hypothetical protein TREMEDRAFT_63204 [Tremella mesenterica DSM 1558]|uniref:uncharacterized protein n=1 Tax=Tremella mesenterica (strain ATCC 24925 / CBS 8224 / DSM 1558 / NBRC 9311 / NRRL Y-6157 / RJB 2259-6 / UBC 559-6) TaxID=578456 RepID=UPI0003F49C4C|nr:uncharacterized protein TREMEDRAFT_63204 [Tremella mesenterica DSM 1558]EIW68743.1 hypothetical protein TREMEDRAFT_63204 [Tremella mesenterica DSM 1558]